MDWISAATSYTINCRVFIEQIHQIYCTRAQLTGVYIENVFDVSLRLFALTCIIKINYPLGAVFVMSQRDKILAVLTEREKHFPRSGLFLQSADGIYNSFLRPNNRTTCRDSHNRIAFCIMQTSLLFSYLSAKYEIKESGVGEKDT